MGVGGEIQLVFHLSHCAFSAGLQPPGERGTSLFLGQTLQQGTGSIWKRPSAWTPDHGGQVLPCPVLSASSQRRIGRGLRCPHFAREVLHLISPRGAPGWCRQEGVGGPAGLEGVWASTQRGSGRLVNRQRRGCGARRRTRGQGAHPRLSGTAEEREGN